MSNSNNDENNNETNKNKESVSKTLIVALVVSLISAVFVAGAAVGLKPIQIQNQQLDKQKSILQIAGLLDATNDNDNNTNTENNSANLVENIFKERIRPQVVDLQTGEIIEDSKEKNINVDNFNAVAVAKNPETSIELTSEQDIAKIRRRENYSVVYWMINSQTGEKENLILPIRGYGLWSTLYGFLAIKAEDLNTVVGLGFYQQGETPGLGGEVDNPRWKAKWKDKTLFAADGSPNIQIVKGGVREDSADAGHQVDALAGASLTSRGVNNLLYFWLGKDGFGKFIQNLKNNPQS